MRREFLLLTAATATAMVFAAHAKPLPAPVPVDGCAPRFAVAPVPPPTQPVLKTGDRLAICGDSITEQRMYSRIIETYLTVCEPDLRVSVRQFGWSGERAEGFLHRMKNDVLRFQPTIATTCYGMNDHQYRPYETWIGDYYRTNMQAVVGTFQAAGTRVVVGSAGCVGRVPDWQKNTSPEYNTDALNLNLRELRNLAWAVSRSEKSAGFADVFSPMIEADCRAHNRYGMSYAIPGKDGVHPDWSGATVMAYAFLHAFGLSGDLGTISLNLQSGKATAANGHEVIESRPGRLTVRSRRYPFCVTPGDLTQAGSIDSGRQWVPFDAELNRLRFVATGGAAKSYRVKWGLISRSYTASELAAGVNLAADFALNPFSDAFAAVDRAVAAKQAFETRQIKNEFHGEAGKKDMEGTAQRTETERSQLVAAQQTAFVPLTHTLEFTAE